MKRNVTLTLEITLIRKLRHLLVEKDLSLSAWIAEKIEKLAAEDERFAQSKSKAQKRLEEGFHLGGSPIRRKDLYEGQNYGGIRVVNPLI
jgi:hypothetical protein